MEEIEVEKKNSGEDLAIPRLATEMVRETVEEIEMKKKNSEEDLAIPGKKERKIPGSYTVCTC